jgi:hypothetical protein
LWTAIGLYSERDQPLAQHSMAIDAPYLALAVEPEILTEPCEKDKNCAVLLLDGDEFIAIERNQMLREGVRHMSLPSKGMSSWHPHVSDGFAEGDVIMASPL